MALRPEWRAAPANVRISQAREPVPDVNARAICRLKGSHGEERREEWPPRRQIAQEEGVRRALESSARGEARFRVRTAARGSRDLEIDQPPRRPDDTLDSGPA